jgi:single-stranded-DNA-specific exonuclease
LITKTLATWLSRINKTEEWLSPKLSGNSNPELILDRDLVIYRITQSLKSTGITVVYGDYDVDGSTSAVILTDAIRKLGGRVVILLASRFRGGYGLSDEAVDDILAVKDINLLITCDCGASDGPRLDRMKAAGVDCLVIDHHLVPKDPLNVVGFLNPQRPECKSKFKWLCSAGLALSVVGGVVKKMGLSSTFDAKQYLDLVALASVCDIVPLIDDNRSLVRAGMAVLSKAERPGIRALMEIAKLPVGHVFSARDLGFKIGPQINAPGRLQSPQVIADLLLSRDSEEASGYAKVIEELSAKRRLITEVITAECIEDIERNGYANDNALVLFADQWGHGIVGIVAARIVDRYNKPTAIIGSEGRGSLRGPPGSRLYDALVFCKDDLLRYGGHQAAAGCQASEESIPAFRDKFNEFFNPATYVPLEAAAKPDPLPLDISDDFLAVLSDLQLLEPCGQGNPKPTISISGKVKSSKAVKGGHLKLDVKLPNGKTMGCFAIAKGEMETVLKPGVQITVLGDLRKNEWQGRVSAEMFVDSLQII